MANTFLDIKNEVTANVIDLPPAVAAAVPVLVNQAVHEIESRYNFLHMKGTTTVSTAEGVSVLATTIANFKEFRDRGPYVVQQFAQAYRLDIALSDAGDVEQVTVMNTDFPSRPRWIDFTIDANNTATFTVKPYPDALSDWNDGNYRIVIPHYAYSATLVNNTDTNWLVNNARDYIVYKATGEGFLKDWDFPSATVWLQKAETKFNLLKQEDKKRRLAGIDTFVPFWRGANQGMVQG